MIAIVSSNPGECAAFAAVCDTRAWPHVTCDSVRAFRALLRHARPSAVLTRNRLNDGYSDDILAALRVAGLVPGTRTIVLIRAGTPSAHEARQVALGADCVYRDPARADVLAEYLQRYRAAGRSIRRSRSRPASAPTFPFAGATVHPDDRTAERAGRVARLTPRELAFAELLAERQGEVTTYQVLYAELLGRRFAGDTSNMRVLLARLDHTLRRLGIRLRDWLEVIPKSGYRYRARTTS